MFKLSDRLFSIKVGWVLLVVGIILMESTQNLYLDIISFIIYIIAVLCLLGHVTRFCEYKLYK